MNPHEMKSLQVQLSKIKAEKDLAYRESNELSGKISNLNKKIKGIQNKLNSVKNPCVTEHGLLRYCERKLGINMRDLRKEILDDKTKEQILTIASGKIPKGDLLLVVKDYSVVSVIPK